MLRTPSSAAGSESSGCRVVDRMGCPGPLRAAHGTKG